MAALKATAGRRVNLHAGGVADERRRVLAVVGPSGTGKTTATLALARRLGYVSDETVSIDPAGTVAPHPKPLSVVVDPQRLRDKEQMSPDDLGLMPTPDEGRLARLGRAASATAQRRVWPGSAPRRECCSSSSSRRRWRSSPGRSTPCWLIEGCGGLWALTYEEIDDHVDELIELLAEPEPTPPGEAVLAPRQTRSRSPGKPDPSSPGCPGPRPSRSTTSSSCSPSRGPCCSPT